MIVQRNDHSSAELNPVRFVTVVAPLAAVNGDTAAGVIGQHLGSRLGQSIVVETRTGATAAANAGRAEQDSFTLLLGTNATHGTNSGLYWKLFDDPVRDLVPVANAGVLNLTVVVTPDMPVHPAPEPVATVQAHPGKLACACGPPVDSV